MTRTSLDDFGGLDIEVTQGLAVDYTFTFGDGTDNWTALDAEMWVFHPITRAVLLHITKTGGDVIPGAAGAVRFKMSRAQTAALPVRPLPYALVMNDGSEDIPVLDGKLLMKFLGGE